MVGDARRPVIKKNAIALAALGALATAAAAQSSVTAFGIVDLSIRYLKNDLTTYQLAHDQQAVVLELMPFNNPTQITDAERAQIKR